MPSTVSVRQKLLSIINKLIASSSIPKVYIPIINGLVDKTMGSVTDEELREHIKEVRDQFIPWLLSDE